jgi:hypothetical protein
VRRSATFCAAFQPPQELYSRMRSAPTVETARISLQSVADPAL